MKLDAGPRAVPASGMDMWTIEELLVAGEEAVITWRGVPIMRLVPVAAPGSAVVQRIVRAHRLCLHPETVKTPPILDDRPPKPKLQVLANDWGVMLRVQPDEEKEGPAASSDDVGDGAQLGKPPLDQ